MTIIEIEDKIIKLKQLKIFIEKNQLKEDDSFEEIVFKKYLELESVSKVAEYINFKGYKFNGQRKYISNDISTILRNKKADVDPELKEFVYKLYMRHKKGGRY